MHKWKEILLSISCLIATIGSYLEDPNDSPDYVIPSFVPNKDIRQNFLNKRRNDRVTAKRVEILDNMTDDNVFVDGVTHYKIDEKHVHIKQVNKIEKAFRNLLGMKGVKYIYRRDPYWRTSRRVKYPDGKDRIVCYRCQNSASCTTCQYSGYWIIEETSPPCTYEIVSVISNEQLCAANLTNTTNVEKQCPSIVDFSDVLGNCDNPIETKWRLMKYYNRNVSELYPAVLCNGRDYCEISTIYTITKDYVSFKIINATNHITYSRIMKNGKKNYACALDCGKINPTTKTVSKTDKPLVVDLINNKNKRDDKEQQDAERFDVSTTTGRIIHPFKNRKFIKAISKTENILHSLKYTENPNGADHHHHHHKKHPSCSSLKHLDYDNSDDDYNMYLQ